MQERGAAPAGPDGGMTAPARNAVPDPIEAWEVRTPDGASIFVRRHGNPDGVALLVSHGNGFAVDAYCPFWSRLADRFDIFIHDLRNHGWNPVSDRMLHNVPQFAEDTERVLRSIGLRLKGAKPIIGVFHSLSSMVALRHAANGGEYSALVLFDPPICPPGGLPEDIEGGGALLSAVTLKRKHKFESPDELAASMSRSPLLGRVSPEVIDLLARASVRPCADGVGYELRCPREYEAQIFEFFFVWSMTVDLERISCPVKVVGSDPTVPYSFMPSMDMRELVFVDYDFLPETSHLLQLEQPEECAALTLEFLAQHGFG